MINLEVIMVRVGELVLDKEQILHVLPKGDNYEISYEGKPLQIKLSEVQFNALFDDLSDTHIKVGFSFFRGQSLLAKRDIDFIDTLGSSVIGENISFDVHFKSEEEILKLRLKLAEYNALRDDVDKELL